MKKPSFVKYNIVAVAVGALIVGMFSTLALETFAFNGPSANPSTGVGAIGTDAANEVSIGTSTPTSGTALLIVGSSTGSGTYGTEIEESNGTAIALFRDDGAVSIETSTLSAGNTIIGGNLTVGGTLSAPNLSGGTTISAGNVSSGQFGSGTGNGNFEFPNDVAVGTSTIVGTFLVSNASSGNAFVVATSGNVGIGTTNPLQTLDMIAGGKYGYNGVQIAEASTTLDNFFFGDAGNLTGTGNLNTAVGFQALKSFTTALGNVAIGGNALVGDSTGANEVVIGNGTFSNDTTGANDTAIGYQIGHNGTSSPISNTTALGYQAGFNLNTSTQNILIGDSAGYNLVTGGGNTVIGNFDSLASTTASTTDINNLIYVTGLTTFTSPTTTISAGNVGIGTTTPATILDVAPAASSTVRIGSGGVNPGCIEVYDVVNSSTLMYIYSSSGALVDTSTKPAFCQ